jgi:hypothetical protein
MFTGAVMAVLAGIDARRRQVKHRDIPKNVTPAMPPGSETHTLEVFMKALTAYRGDNAEEQEKAATDLRAVISTILRIDPENKMESEMMEKLMRLLSKK